MDANVTSPHSEPDQDNSSLQNPSTNPAEAGTTDETRDEDHETSSIEALNWSEVEEEELAAAQKAEAAAREVLGKSTPTSEAKVISSSKEEDEVDNDNKENNANSSSTNGSSTVLVNEEGNVLSTSLLQSINSTVSDEDPQARKLSVIENWASEVTASVERGEMEMAEDFPDEDGVTGDDEGDDDEDDDGEVINEGGVRKRRGKKLTPDMVSSVLSTASHTESSVDPLSDAPVLDDGPIWNKGPRSYTFQENRRINQKLTFCVLIAVVLAIGLGVGNLIAHQECEAEFKATQKSVSTKPVERSPIPQTIPTTTPSPIIPDRSTDSSMMGSKLPTRQNYPSVESIDIDNDKDDDPFGDAGYKETVEPPPKDNIKRRDEPIIDPKYRMHAETVSNVVHTLDQLSRKIDQFENTTRKLQGVLMIPDEEEKTKEESESSSLYDEQIHRDDDETLEDFTLGDEVGPTMTDVEDLIDAIEQTPDYLERQKEEEKIKKLDENRPRSKLFDLEKLLPAELNREWKKMMKSFEKYREFERRFITSERKKLKDEGKYDRFKWRVPEQYTDEEKKALNNKFKSTWIEFVKLTNKDSPNPLDAIFGVEEDIEERTYGDVFHYPWPDPDLELTDEEYGDQFSKNLEDLRKWEIENKDLLAEEEKNDIPDLTIKEVFPDTSAEPVESLDDDLIIMEEVAEQKEAEIPRMESEPSSPPPTEKLESQDNGKLTAQSDKQYVSEVPSNPDTPQSSSVLSTTEIKNMSKESKDSETAGQNAHSRMKRDSHKESSAPPKSKKSPGHKSANDNVGSSVVDENKKSGKGKGGKRSEQKQKEPKPTKGGGKQKGNKMGSDSTPTHPKEDNPRNKMSSKSKKLKNLESNKVFENVKGKNYEKRRVTPSSREGSGPTGRQDASSREAPINKTPSSSQNSKKPQRESTNNGRTPPPPPDRRAKPNPKYANNNQQQGKPFNNRNNEPPRHYDAKDKENQPPSHPQNGNKERGPSPHENGRSPTQLKYDNQEFSSKESQHRQQKQEFNTNRYNGKSNTGNRKGKNWQGKEKADRDRPRERASSWGN